MQEEIEVSVPVLKGDFAGLNNKLFVYGIFLDEDRRKSYGMTNPRYATVKDYATFGGGIVWAKHIPECGLSLTGLLVDVDPKHWDRLDALEAGYDRKIVNAGVKAYMYVGRE